MYVLLIYAGVSLIVLPILVFIRHATVDSTDKVPAVVEAAVTVIASSMVVTLIGGLIAAFTIMA
ncbi:MAG: hypothetical protein AAF078_00540 [Planctomycetota bacterium]